MAFVYLDESGDLGFNFTKKKTSSHFVITCFSTENRGPIEKVVKKVHGELSKKHKKKTSQLHAYKESPKTRTRLLSLINDKDCSIMTICLNKAKVYTQLKNEKAFLYNYVANILLDRIYTKKLVPVSKSVTLIASRRETNKFLNENFKSYLNRQAKQNHKIELNVEVKTPFEEKILQATDFVSWAIFRKYEHGDDSYYNLVKSKIIEEKTLF